MTRRSFLAAAGAAPLLRAAEPPTVISRQPDLYHGWPALTRRRNGELLVAYSGGREQHVCPYGRVELIRSRDDGKTWSWPEVVLDTAIDDRDAGIVETPSGALLVTTFTSLAYEASLAKNPKWQPVQARTTPEQRRTLLDTWMLRSTDGGLTWSAPYRVPANSPHGPVALDDGRLLYAGKQLWQPGQKIGVCESTDDGRTWRWLAVIPARPGDDPSKDYHELHAVDAGRGRIVAQIRNHNPRNAGETLQTESSDGGKTWTTPHTIGVWGLPSHLLRLRDGRLVMTYGYRRAPFGIQARLSKDRGDTWSDPIMLTNDGAGGDLGYPSTAELANGALLTVWYEKLADSPKAVLRQTRWTV
jgi:Neuraminidase (sialidase)